MNTNELRFHVMRLFFFHQPENGWTVDRLVTELKELDPDLKPKPVRTFLNNLSDPGVDILVTTFHEGTKRYFLNREDLVFDELSGESGDARELRASDALAMLFTSFLELMGQEDAGPAANRLVRRLGFTYGDQKRWMRIMDARQLIQWQNQKLFGSTLRDLDLVGRLLSGGEGKCWELTRLDGSVHLFVFSRMVVRQGVLLCVGSDGSEKLFELMPEEIRELEETREGPVTDAMSPALKQCLDLSHLSIGSPEAGQDEEIELAITSDDAFERIQSASLPLDSELDTAGRRLLLWHQLSSGLADWIIGLGPGVEVVRPAALRAGVLQRLRTMLEAYEARS